MERLQAGFLFRKNETREALWYMIRDNGTSKKGAPTQFSILSRNQTPPFLSKKEKLMDYRYTIEEQSDILMELVDDKNELDSIVNSFCFENKIICSPYYNINNKKEVYLPCEIIDYVCGTNGLCAGNTSDEAILQGVCEILERYAMKEIFCSHVTPPDIPIEFFEDSYVYKLIQNLPQKYKVFIKDASLGLQLPVICLCVIDTTNNTYGVSFGSEPSPSIALERCFTEMYQGGIDSWFRPLKLYENIDSVNEYKNQFKYSRGYLPKSFFALKPSYDFQNFYHESKANNKKDLQLIIIDIVKKANRNIYIQDLSYLGFPTYRVYIPGWSEIQKLTLRVSTTKIKLNGIRSLLSRIELLSIDEILELLTSLEEIGPLKSNFYNDILFYNSHEDLNELQFHLLLAMLNYKASRINDAYNHFDKFYISSNVDNIYYTVIHNYLSLLREEHSLEEISDYLLRYYNEDIVKNVIDDLKDPLQIFRYYLLPTCLDCNTCKIQDSCILNEIVDMNDHLTKKFEEYEPDYSVFHRYY